MLINRKPSVCPGFPVPEPGEQGQEAADIQKEAHDQRTRTRDIFEGDKVFVSSFSSGPKLLPERSLWTSDTMVEVAQDDRRRVGRHANHVRARL